jgi:hypothetical protein
MHDKWCNDDYVTTLELTDNSEEEIEEVERFIQIILDDYEPEKENKKDLNIVKLSSLLCLGLLVGSYTCKAIYIINRIMK